MGEKSSDLSAIELTAGGKERSVHDWTIFNRIMVYFASVTSWSFTNCFFCISKADLFLPF
jgi:hypothetical protein